MSARKNDKQKSLGIIGAIPEFIGVLVGISMIAGRWIERHIRNLLSEKLKQPKQAAKTPVQIDAEKRIAAIEEKMTGHKRVKTKKKSAKKKKTVKKAKKKKKKISKKNSK